MKDNSNQSNESLELYKLHVELTDRMMQRRDGADRLYAGLLVGVATISTIVIRFGNDEVSAWVILMLGLLGIAISFSWNITITVYQRLLWAKIEILNEMENDLSFQFSQKEDKIWAESPPDKDILYLNILLRLLKLKHGKNLLPTIFYVFFGLWTIINLIIVLL